MESQQVVKDKKTLQNIQLVKGEFTPSEASDVIRALIDQKINFHKIQRMQLWEGSHDGEMGPLNGRIEELQEEKKNAKKFIAKMRGLGRNIKIDGVLKITDAE